MSRVQELIGEVKRPPFDIMRAAHVELVVRDLDASLHFYDELLGLVVTERTAEAAYLRGWEEYLHHSLVLRVGDEPAIDHVSLPGARATRTSTRSPRTSSAAAATVRGRPASRPGPRHARPGSARLPARVLPRDGLRRAAARRRSTCSAARRSCASTT